MIYADRPRRYKKRGKRWSHLIASTSKELLEFARDNGIKRIDRKPRLHLDVTEEELRDLQVRCLITIVDDKIFRNIMKNTNECSSNDLAS